MQHPRAQDTPSAWEKVGVRGAHPLDQDHHPHPNPLPEGQGTTVRYFFWSRIASSTFSGVNGRLVTRTPIAS
jgi:hypothetical protein